tara:strand:- start:35017 stop:36534 length:1518 start_codon:yes stop_codon:yes gene_type:complete
MKTTKTTFWSFILLTAMCISYSCTDGFDDLNTDPKLITDDEIKPSLLFTRVLKESSFEILNVARIGEFSNYIKRGDSGNILTLTDYSEPFDDYTSYIENLEAVIRLTEDNPELKNQNAMARIWRVWVYHRITDAYGDVPYSEVATSYEDIILYPKYDSQEFVYTDMLKELKEAAAILSNSSSQEGFGAADILYGGDPDSWERFANSLRLRLALRVRYVNQALAENNIGEVFNSSLISTNEQNAVVTSEGEDAVDLANTNPLYQQVVNGSAGAISSVTAGLTLVENLKSTNDPRLSIYLEPNEDMEYFGGAINLTAEERETYPRSARWSQYFRNATYDFNVLQASEVNFLMAEAVLAGLATGDANTLYQNGISIAMEQYGVDATAISEFLSSPWGTLSGSEEQKLEMIITQKYLALIGDSYEAYTEHRRTGYPKIWIGSEPSAETDGALPRRLPYPIIEYNLNPSGVEGAAALLEGGDKMKSHLWWDVKEGLPFAHPKQGVFPPYE